AAMSPCEREDESRPQKSRSSRLASMHSGERFPEHVWGWSRAHWRAEMQGLGEPAYRGDQLFRWWQQRGVTDPAAMSDVPQALRQRLATLPACRPAAAPQLLSAHPSTDGTTKLLLGCADGRRLETVLLPERDRRAPGSRHYTLCVSSQVGCAVGCVFCASGLRGLQRHLHAAEIVAQVQQARAYLQQQAPSAGRIHRLVFMGMGEPLHNYVQVREALRILSDPQGLGLSLRRMVLSTSGLVPQMRQLAADFGGQLPLALSLHAADDALRQQLVPIGRRYPLAEVIAALRDYPLPARERFTIEYTLIRGINDTPRHAKAVLRLLEGLPYKVNVIPFNPVPELDFEAPEPAAVLAFQTVLRRAGIGAWWRRQRGDGVAAACGQLALHPDASGHRPPRRPRRGAVARQDRTPTAVGGRRR
ncbi:MAG: 23S rRNA (adenine(2503)-C(2))-methyltransferase RlmN, partial [Polyangiales bacterium]